MDDLWFKVALLVNVALASFLSGAGRVLGVLALALLACELIPPVGSESHKYVPRDTQKYVVLGNIAATLAALLLL